MLRTILFSLAALVLVMLVARGCGITPEQVESRLLLADLNAEEGNAYRTANRARTGVVELADGLQAEVLVVGSGPTPQIDDWVSVHYRGMHIDGRVFDDSWRRGDPAVVAIERVIEGWRRILVGLPAGSRVRLVIPPDLAYGRAGGGPVGPEETPVFELELIGIAPPPQTPDADPAQDRVPGLR